jgi:uncharacterized membrane protein
VTTIEQEIEIDAPIDVAYDQWTQFEEFPRFMENVKAVRQLDETRLAWTAEVGGQDRTWEAKIVEQHHNRLIAWRAIDDEHPSGSVRFEPADGGQHTRVKLRMEYEPHGLKEKVGSVLQLDDLEVRRDLQRFKDLVEKRQVPSGEWSGRIEGGRVTEPDKSDR